MNEVKPKEGRRGKEGRYRNVGGGDMRHNEGKGGRRDLSMQGSKKGFLEKSSQSRVCHGEIVLWRQGADVRR